MVLFGDSTLSGVKYIHPKPIGYGTYVCTKNILDLLKILANVVDLVREDISVERS